MSNVVACNLSFTYPIRSIFSIGMVFNKLGISSPANTFVMSKSFTKTEAGIFL